MESKGKWNAEEWWEAEELRCMMAWRAASI